MDNKTAHNKVENMMKLPWPVAAQGSEAESHQSGIQSCRAAEYDLIGDNSASMRLEQKFPRVFRDIGGNKVGLEGEMVGVVVAWSVRKERRTSGPCPIF
jgi:hypothetical protein